MFQDRERMRGNKMQLFGKEGWSERAAMKTKRRGFGVAVLNDLVFIVGGHDESFLSSVEVYDPQTDSWSDRAPLNVPRRNLGVEVVDGKIYALGGFTVKNTFEVDADAVEVYDPDTDRWTLLPSPMKTPRLSFGTAVVDGKIWVIGGSNCFGFLDSVESFDPISLLWTSLPPLTLMRNGLGTVSVNGSVYAIGGYDGQSVSLVEVFDDQRKRWRRVASVPPRSIFGISVFNGLIFLAGGFRDGEILSSVDVFDPASNSFGSTDSLITPRANFRLVSLANSLLAIGGSFDKDTMLASVESW